MSAISRRQQNGIIPSLFHLQALQGSLSSSSPLCLRSNIRFTNTVKRLHVSACQHQATVRFGVDKAKLVA